MTACHAYSNPTLEEFCKELSEHLTDDTPPKEIIIAVVDWYRHAPVTEQRKIW